LQARAFRGRPGDAREIARRAGPPALVARDVSSANEPRRSLVPVSVLGLVRVTIAALTARIDAPLGPRAGCIQLFGDSAGGDTLARRSPTS
jgi:hypothetical protein